MLLTACASACMCRFLCATCACQHTYAGGRQKDFVETEKSLGRTDPAQISALVGYAGGQVGAWHGMAGHGRACMHGCHTLCMEQVVQNKSSIQQARHSPSMC